MSELEPPQTWRSSGRARPKHRSARRRREDGFTPVGAAAMVSRPKEEETHGRSQGGAGHSKQPDLPVTHPWCVGVWKDITDM